MKKRVKVVIIATIFLVAGLLALIRIRFQASGLQKDAMYTEVHTDLEAVSDEESHINMVLKDRIHIDADVSVGDGEYSEYAIEASIFPAEKAQKLLEKLTNSDIASKEEYEDGDYALYTTEQSYMGNNTNTINSQSQ